MTQTPQSALTAITVQCRVNVRAMIRGAADTRELNAATSQVYAQDISARVLDVPAVDPRSARAQGEE